MKNVINLSLIGLVFLAAGSNACAIERSELMMCGFADGSEVKLKATYDWSPVGALLKVIGDVSSRSKQTGYKAHFRGANGWLSEAPGGPGYRRPVDEQKLVLHAGASICAEVAKWHGRPMVNDSFLQDDGNWFDVDAGRYAVWLPKLSVFYESMPKWVGPHLRQLNGAPVLNGFSLVAPVGGIFVNEQPIGDFNSEVVIRAVYQSISKDGGKTWSAPILTPNAYIFEIGRQIEDQSFVGRPLSFEGRQFPVPKFTKPQTQEEREEAIRQLPPEWRKVRSAADIPQEERGVAR